MLRLVFTVAVGLLVSVAYGQLRKFYSLKETAPFHTMEFSLDATTGNCVIKPATEKEGPLSIYGNPDLDHINPSFKSSIIDGTCKVHLNLQQFRKTEFSEGFMFAMMRPTKPENNFWKILLDDEVVYRLNLSYGFGNADVDLSGSAVQNFRLKSGGADVLIDYQDNRPNSIVMDTFLVKVDMGSVVARHLELTRAKYVSANIGFGRAMLDFRDAVTSHCTVNASVGAGSLDIFVPSKDVPIIIYINESPLCGIQVAKGFEEVEKNVFVNMSYHADAENLLTFNIDVALGSVTFHYAE